MAALLKVAAEVSTSSAGGLFASLLRTQGARSFHGGAHSVPRRRIRPPPEAAGAGAAEDTGKEA